MLVLAVLSCREANAAVPVIAPMTESQKQGAVFLDALSIPSPGEVFAALNKSSHPNWAALITPAEAPLTTDRSQLALAVGVMAANGYIAVEAQDGQQVKNIGREMMSSAKALGVSQNLMGRGDSLIEFAANDAWDSLADELEATENEVKASMVEQKDHVLVTLTSAAAWLRGLDVATQVVLTSETLQGASLIRQQELAHMLSSQLDTLPERMKQNILVSRVKRTLDNVAQLLSSQPGSPEAERRIIQQIHESTSSLVKEILTSSDMPAAKRSAQPTVPPPSLASPMPVATTAPEPAK